MQTQKSMHKFKSKVEKLQLLVHKHLEIKLLQKMPSETIFH